MDEDDPNENIKKSGQAKSAAVNIKWVELDVPVTSQPTAWSRVSSFCLPFQRVYTDTCMIILRVESVLV